VSFQSCFTRTFDVIIFGTGYAAFGAALHLLEQNRSICIVSRQSDLLWESGRAYMPHTGASDHPLWSAYMAELKQRNATTKTETDGALSEVIATHFLAQKNIDLLYYSTPVAIEQNDTMLEAVIVATKSGYHRLVAKQWIDATETGEVIRQIDPQAQPRTPSKRHLFAYYQALEWPNQTDQHLSLETADLTWSSTLWPRQRRLTITLPGQIEHPRKQIIPALQAFYDTNNNLLNNTALSHCSLIDCPEYGADKAPLINLPQNVLTASPALCNRAIQTLSDRFVLGVDMASQLEQMAQCTPPDNIFNRPINPVPQNTLHTEVLVAGAGTGGAYASIAAARSGAQVTTIEPYDFPGGIGAGGGIHWYYYGIPGGLQAEADQRTLDIMHLFGGKKHTRGFHPEARKLILEDLFDESGITFLKGTLVCAAHQTDRTVTHITLAGANGLTHLYAHAFIDATGDGDLAVQAGASFIFGRKGDGLVHAYSQSGGRLGIRDNHISMELLNFDAGFTDPTDAEDLTRARIAGICHYLKDTYSDESRWTYIAPAIGLRQSRQINTDYVVTLADLIERRKFPDAVGYTGAHYDNHAVDCEFESDEGLFWVWLCRQWREGRTACEIPYRMILPKDLDNVWIACRAAGVSQDAHHSFRMQRDIQRLGEIAGDAAALSVQHQSGARDIPFAKLRQKLADTGALDLKKSNDTRDFGPTDGINTLSELTDNTDISHEQIEAGLADLHAGKPSQTLWYLYRAQDTVQNDVVKALNSQNPLTSWLAAGILALWGDTRAEHRLLTAIRAQEYGYEDTDEAKTPEKFNRVVPNWMAAISFLRTCGTKNTLPVFQDFIGQGNLTLNVRTGMSLTLERLVDRNILTHSDRETVNRLLIALASHDIPDIIDLPVRNLTTNLTPKEPLPKNSPASKTQDNYRWQLVLVLSRISQKLGLPMPPEAEQFKNDKRALVRRAFEEIIS
jgi:hypothetical protein